MSTLFWPAHPLHGARRQTPPTATARVRRRAPGERELRDVVAEETAIHPGAAIAAKLRTLREKDRGENAAPEGGQRPVSVSRHSGSPQLEYVVRLVSRHFAPCRPVGVVL